MLKSVLCRDCEMVGLMVVRVHADGRRVTICVPFAEIRLIVMHAHLARMRIGDRCGSASGP